MKFLLEYLLTSVNSNTLSVCNLSPHVQKYIIAWQIKNNNWKYQLFKLPIIIENKWNKMKLVSVSISQRLSNKIYSEFCEL